MEDRVNLKLVTSSANDDLLISYTTDVQPVFVKHSPWFADRHRHGQEFADTLVTAGSTVLEDSAKQIKEETDAVQATGTQDRVQKAAVAIARDVRKRGRYVAKELLRSGKPDELALVGKVRASCGINKNIHLGRQSGVRKLLTIQSKGLPQVADVFSDFRQPADLLSRVQAALAELRTAIERQSAEQIEADAAQDVLDRSMDKAVEEINSALRLVNVELESVPEALYTSLKSIQGDHPGVFRSPPED